RGAGAGQNEFLDVALEAERFDVFLIETRQDGDREDFEILFYGGGGVHDRAVAVNGHKCNWTIGELGHRGFYGFRDVEEFQVGENLFAARGQPIDEFVIAAGHEELQAEFVEDHRVAEFFDPL